MILPWGIWYIDPHVFLECLYPFHHTKFRLFSYLACWCLCDLFFAVQFALLDNNFFIFVPFVVFFVCRVFLRLLSDAESEPSSSSLLVILSSPWNDSWPDLSCRLLSSGVAGMTSVVADGVRNWWIFLEFNWGYSLIISLNFMGRVSTWNVSSVSWSGKRTTREGDKLLNFQYSATIKTVLESVFTDFSR